MGIFKARQPRGYRRVSIYTDERKEKLQRLVDEAKREEGDPSVEQQPYDVHKFHGKFINYTPNARRYRENGAMVKWPIALIAVIVLILIWHYLLTGNIRF